MLSLWAARAVEVWGLDHDTRDARPVDNAMLDGIRATALEAAAMLREGRFPLAVEASRCSHCAMRGLCPAGQEAIATGAGEWPPTDVADGSGPP